MRDWKKELGWTEEQIDELRNIAFSYIRQGKYETALPLFHALAVVDHDSVYDLQLLGAIYVELNRPQLAIRQLNKALQLNGDHSPTLLNLAKAFFMSGMMHDGVRLVKILQNDKDPMIASSAKALLLCYEGTVTEKKAQRP